MPTITKEELQERAQLVRTLEASCRIEFPSADEANFRLAVMKKLGLLYGLKEMRNMTITGPVTQAMRPAAAPVRVCGTSPSPAAQTAQQGQRLKAKG